MVGEPMGYAYVTFDDDVARGAAEADPAGFVADLPARAILDAVQRVPALYRRLCFSEMIRYCKTLTSRALAAVCA
jgi:hypothetical protein